MKAKKACKLLYEAAYLVKDSRLSFRDRYDLYVWMEGVAGEYLDLKWKEENKKLKYFKNKLVC